MNTDAPWPDLDEAERRVLKIQTKLHQWAVDDPDRCFDDLYNLVHDPAVLVVARARVRGNRGARSAGVDGVKPRSIAFGKEAFLSELRDSLKARTFTPLPVRQRFIPKKGGKFRGLGIPTARDRAIQAALLVVLEPIFEADFHPCSYGFRPGRRAHDAIAEIHHFATHSYEWVVEGDIKACFDEISHTALLQRMQARIGDRRVMALVKAFLKAGVLSEDGVTRHADTGTPQGGILSPLLSNVALSVLDEHFAGAWDQAMGTSPAREKRRRQGLANYRLIRYADDWVVMVAGNRGDAERLRDEAAVVLAPMGLRLAEDKTRICHIDEGFEFLGFHIKRKRKRGTARSHVYTYPSKKALLTVCDKVRTISRQGRNDPLTELLRRINPVLRGWCNYFRHGVSKATFQYLCSFAWRRITIWLRSKHPRANWKWLRRHYLPGWWPTEGEATMFNPSTVPVIRYRYRGYNIPSPWATTATGIAA